MSATTRMQEIAAINARYAAAPELLERVPARDRGGFVWLKYKVAYMRQEWRSEGGLLSAGENSGLSYWAKVGGVLIGKRYRTLDAAMIAAGKASGHQR